MKKIVYSLLALALLSTTACKKDFLNKTPLDKYSDEAVWKDPSLVQTFVNNIYLGIPHGFSNIMMSAMVDETTYNADFGSSNVTLSRITPSDYSIFDEGFWTANRQRGMNWSIVYKFIRSANLFFEKIDGVSFAEAAQKDRLKGEVHFLRAYLYYNLVSMYGGVPLIDKTYTLKDESRLPVVLLMIASSLLRLIWIRPQAFCRYVLPAVAHLVLPTSAGPPKVQRWH
jgi:hypothetical protein